MRFNGMFFKRDQSSNYMRGTATSIITDKKKFVGSIMSSNGLKGEMLLENVFANTIGEGFRALGGGNVEVRNFQVDICGRQVGITDDKTTLIVNGEKF